MITGTITVDEIVNQVLRVKIGDTGYVYVVDENGIVIIHPNKEISNKKNILEVSDFSPEINKFGEVVVKGGAGFSNYVMDGEKKYVAYTQIPNMDWSIVVTVPEHEVNSTLINLTIKSIIIIVILIRLVILVIFKMTKRIFTPIELLEANANRIANGDLSQSIVNINSKDEIGRLAQAFKKMLEKLYISYESLKLRMKKFLLQMKN